MARYVKYPKFLREEAVIVYLIVFLTSSLVVFVARSVAPLFGCGT